MQTIRRMAGGLLLALLLLTAATPSAYGRPKRPARKHAVAKTNTKKKTKTAGIAKKKAKTKSAEAASNAADSIIKTSTLDEHPLIKAPAQKGKASYYSLRINGHKTSSGERLNNDSLVCAHRTHPFNTRLLVRNPANGKEVVVRVIDRGPYSKGRIIDLSYEAARRLGMLSAGVAMVEVSVYNETHVPYRPKDDYKVPELELEMNDGGDPLNPAWKKKQKEE